MLNMKAWAQLAVAVVVAVWAALTDSASGDTITTQEWVVIAGTGIGAFVVWVVPNLDTGIGKYAKTIASFATAGLSALYVVIPGGLTTAEMLEVLVAGASAIGLVVGVTNVGYRFARKAPTVGQAVQGAAPPV
jgi:hypothetical protein